MIMMDDKEIFDKLVEDAINDPNVIGLFLSGSRGKGLTNKHADYDVEIIVKDKVIKDYKKKYQKKHIKNFEFAVFSLSGFKHQAEIGGPYEWDRPSYTHIKAIVDKTGQIQKLIDEKGKIPKDIIKKYVSRHLDGYINYVYRSLKCFRDGNVIGARLEAARTIDLFFNVIFGLEGRVTPFYKFLKWELKLYPLKRFPMLPKEIIKTLLRILEDADVQTQQGLFVIVERVFRKEGYAHVFDSWDPDSIKFIKTFKKIKK